MEFGFVGPAYLGRSTAIESEKCINWYLEVSGPNAKSRMSLIPTPGMISFTQLIGAARGMYTLNDTLYAAAAGGMLDACHRRRGGVRDADARGARSLPAGSHRQSPHARQGSIG